MEIEAMAIIYGLSKFQKYFEYRKLVIQCDISVLTRILNHPHRQVGKLAPWI